MGKFKDITGQRFGRLIAIRPTEKRVSGNGSIVWECICDCGKKYEVSSNALNRKATQSCGCLWTECMKKVNTKHGMSNTSIYKKWEAMIQRCENPNHKSYKNYGGRGITVSEEFHDFQIWYEHIGPYPGPGYSQDRIDNDGNYERGNIQWATCCEQNLNCRPASCGPHKQRWFLAFDSNTGEWDEDNNQNEFARRYGFNSHNISACLHGKHSHCKGWTFQWLPA